MNTEIEKNQTVNTYDLEHHVKAMYRDVALHPESDFHFEMGRKMAERLGYASTALDEIPQESIASFAGVGCHFDLLDLSAGDAVVDLGSGSGMDTFVAAFNTGTTGKVVGVDMTDEQREKAIKLQSKTNYSNIEYKKAYIEDTGLDADVYDAVISNGVVNLAADKLAVFKEAYRILKTGGQLALSDIVTEIQLPENVTCDATLWAACIGGALQQQNYVDCITAAGFRVITVRDNPGYHFISDGAKWATDEFGVKSISLIAVKD